MERRITRSSTRPRPPAGDVSSDTGSDTEHFAPRDADGTNIHSAVYRPHQRTDEVSTTRARGATATSSRLAGNEASVGGSEDRAATVSSDDGDTHRRASVASDDAGAITRDVGAVAHSGSVHYVGDSDGAITREGAADGCFVACQPGGRCGGTSRTGGRDFVRTLVGTINRRVYIGSVRILRRKVLGIRAGVATHVACRRPRTSGGTSKASLHR